MPLFAKDPEKQAAKEAAQQARRTEREAELYRTSPPGLARAAYERGDRLFQYSHDVEAQQAVIVAMVGSTTTRSTSDPSEILNAVAAEGWDLVNASFVFREQGSQSRDKFMSSGQNVAVKGTTVGYYVFVRRGGER